MRALEATERRVVGGYALRALLGRGGMSEVYAASHPVKGDRLALKLLRDHLASDGAAEQAFFAEAAQTRAVSHKNVVRVLDVGRDESSGCCFLVMERIDGEDLATRLRRTTRLDEAPVRALFAQIADGMHVVHARGLVHRDLKPANVMLHGDEPKIVDFGIAKFLGDQSAVSTGRRVGSPAYMAPEQLTGGLIAPCVDVWALGVMLFEALTGRLPFEGFTEGRCPQLFEVAPRVGTLVAVTPALDRLVARCLERDPGRRPRSMDEIARELRGELDGDAEPERITQDVGAAKIAPALPIAPAPPLPAPPMAVSRSRSRWWIAPVAVAFAIGVGLLAARLVGEETQAPAPVAVVSPPPPAPVEHAVVPVPVPATTTPTLETPALDAPAPDAPPATIAVEVRSAPAGAQILVGGTSRGLTPKRLELAGPTSIVVRRAGYRATSVRADRAGMIEVHLVPLPKRKRASHKKETLD